MGFFFGEVVKAKVYSLRVLYGLVPRGMTLLAVYTVLCLAWIVDIFGQSATAPFVIRLVNVNGDTVVYTRTPTAFRAGATFGASLPYHFGNLISPVSTQYTCDQFYNLKPGGLGSGGGSVGLILEYVPVTSPWGISLQANFPDYRAMSSLTPFPPPPGRSVDILERSILTQVATMYCSFQPQVRYKPVDNSGLHFLLGGNLEIATAGTMSRSITRQELDRSEIVRKIPFVIEQFRFGFSLGAGWDAFVGVVGGFRMIVTPGLSIQGGTPMYSTYGSTWNSLIAKATFAIKFSPDVIGEEIVPAALIPLKPPTTISALQGSNSKLSNNVDVQNVAIGMLLPREPLIENIIEKKESNAGAPSVRNGHVTTPSSTTKLQGDSTKETPSTQQKSLTTISVASANGKPTRIPFKGKLRINTPEVFASYKSERDTALTPEILGYLDEVVKMMKSNSTLLLRIEGHTDNFSSSAGETQRISDERALQVVRFMMDQGIARSRLLASGFGARNPVASNRTPQGRAANRRVEISILRP